VSEPLINPRFYDDLARECLAELADADFQERTWTGKDPEPGVVASYIEAVCGLFDDSNLNDALSEDGWAYGEPVDSLIRDLGDLVDATDEFQPYDVLFADPHFLEARRVAAQIRDLLAERPMGLVAGNPIPPRR